MPVFYNTVNDAHVYRVITSEGMEPEFTTGDDVFIDQHRVPCNGDYVVACFPGSPHLVLGQFFVYQGRPVLAPVDPNYHAMIMMDLSPIHGVVIYRGRHMGR